MPASLAAQPGPRFDAELGAAVLRQRGGPARTAPTLGGVWAWDGARTALRVDGVVAATGSDWAGQLAAHAAYFAFDPDAPVEIGAEARAARVAGTRGTTQLVAGVRRHLTAGGVLRPTRGVWAGVLGGATVGGVRGTATLLGVEAGAWRAISAAARAVVTATLTATRADSAALVSAWNVTDPVPFAPTSSRVRTFDAVTAVEHIGPHVELAASAGARHTTTAAGAAAGAGVRWGPLAIGAVTWWVRPGVGAVVAAGAHPADPARGLPAVQHVAFSVRLRPRAWTGTPPAAARLPETLGRVTPPPVTIAADGRALRVEAPRAARVQIRAAATAWRAVDLVRDADGSWSVALAWPSGAHRVAIRVDDGPWQPPANTPAVDDEFGGRVGLLVVP